MHAGGCAWHVASTAAAPAMNLPYNTYRRAHHLLWPGPIAACLLAAKCTGQTAVPAPVALVAAVALLTWAPYSVVLPYIFHESGIGTAAVSWV